MAFKRYNRYQQDIPPCSGAGFMHYCGKPAFFDHLCVDCMKDAEKRWYTQKHYLLRSTSPFVPLTLNLPSWTQYVENFDIHEF